MIKNTFRLDDSVKRAILSGEDGPMFKRKDGKIVALRFDEVRFEPAVTYPGYVIVLAWGGRAVAFMSVERFQPGNTFTVRGIKANLKLELTQ